MEWRDTAVHVWISELCGGKMVQVQDRPSALVVNDQSLGRVRLHGIVVGTEELVVDDGTGSMLVRSFEQQWSVRVGDPVVVIGRPRLYDGELYILGEIVKKVDLLWLEVRKKVTRAPVSGDVGTRVVDIVRRQDTGDGADYDAVVSELGDKGEELIVHLLATGALFETKPGKLKVLE